jgi:hypothetical protein
MVLRGGALFFPVDHFRYDRQIHVGLPFYRVRFPARSQAIPCPPGKTISFFLHLIDVVSSWAITVCEEEDERVMHYNR